MAKNQVPLKVKLTIICCATLAFCGVMLETAMNVTFPTLMSQFSLPLSVIQWVATGYLLAVAITMSLAAYIQRRFSFRLIMSVAVILFIGGGLLCAGASQFWMLFAGRMIQGVSTGMIMPLLFTIIMVKIPHQIQGQYVGTAGMVVALAPSVGPSYGGFVTQTFSWRLMFWLVIPIGLLAGLMAVIVTEKSKSSQSDRLTFPIFQFICLALMLTGFIIGFNQIGSAGIKAPITWGSLVIGLIGLVMFLILSRKSKHPLINLHIFLYAGYRNALGLYFLMMFMQVSQTFLVPSFAQIVLKTDTFVAGALLLAGSFSSVFLAPLAGKLLDRHPFKLSLLIGILFVTFSSLFLLGLSHRLTSLIIVVGFLAFMIGFSFIFNNAMTYGLQQLPEKLVGDGNATFNTLQQYAGSLSTAVVGMIITIIGGSHTSAIDMIHSATAVYLMLLLLSLALIWLGYNVIYAEKKSNKKD